MPFYYARTTPTTAPLLNLYVHLAQGRWPSLAPQAPRQRLRRRRPRPRWRRLGWVLLRTSTSQGLGFKALEARASGQPHQLPSRGGAAQDSQAPGTPRHDSSITSSLMPVGVATSSSWRRAAVACHSEDSAAPITMSRTLKSSLSWPKGSDRMMAANCRPAGLEGGTGRGGAGAEGGHAPRILCYCAAGPSQRASHHRHMAPSHVDTRPYHAASRQPAVLWCHHSSLPARACPLTPPRAADHRAQEKDRAERSEQDLEDRAGPKGGRGCEA